MNKPSKALLSQVSVALAHGVESDVSIPSRARSHSFASVLADMKVGEPPAARAMPIELSNDPAFSLKDAMSDAKDRLRNNVQPSMSQASRRVDGAKFSCECNIMVADSGMYAVALVRRIA